MFAVIILVVITIVVIFLFVKLIGNRWPWVWENIGRPLMNYFFVTSVRKVTIRYFSALIVFNSGFPLLKLGINLTTPDYTFSTAFSFENTWFDWLSIILSLCATLVYIKYIGYEKYLIEKADGTVNQVAAMAGRTSSEIVTDLIPKLATCIDTLHVNTAVDILVTLREKIANTRFLDYALLSKVDFLKGKCKRFVKMAECNELFKLSYEEIEKAGKFDKDAYTGRIIAACAEKDKDTALALSKELKERHPENKWSYIPQLFFSKDLGTAIASLPQELQNDYSLFGELLVLGKEDVMQVVNPIDMEVPEIKEMTIDNFVLWPFWMSVCLTKFLSGWKLRSHGICDETPESALLLKMSTQYFELINSTQLADPMPDMKMVHVYVQYCHDHCPSRLEEMKKCHYTGRMKDFYYLAYATMMQNEGKELEAFELLSRYGDGLNVNITNSMLQLALHQHNIDKIKEVLQLEVDKGVKIYDEMMNNHCGALHFCGQKVETYIHQLDIVNEISKRFFIEIGHHYCGRDVDIDYMEKHEHEACVPIIPFIALVYLDKGMADRGIALLEPEVPGNAFDFRSHVFILLLSSNEKYNSKLFRYLGQLREANLASDDLLSKELWMAEKMMEWERCLAITTLLIKNNPQNGALMEHHLMALYRNEKSEEVEKLFGELHGLEFPVNSVMNIFNVYLLLNMPKKALAFLYDEIEKNNTQELRDFFFQVHIHHDIEKIIMEQYEVVSADSYVMIDEDGKEKYTDIVPGSYLDDLIGKKVGESIVIHLFNKDVEIHVMAIFNRYFKLMKQVMDEIGQNRSKAIRSFHVDDLLGGEGFLANLKKLTGSEDDDYKKELDNAKQRYMNGELSLLSFIGQHNIFQDLYNNLFGEMKIYMMPLPIERHNVQVTEFDLAAVQPVLDLTSLMLIHELQLRFSLSFNKKFIVPKNVQVAIKDGIAKEQAGMHSGLYQDVIANIVIPKGEEHEPLLMAKLKMLSKWIDDNCEVETDETLLDHNINEKHAELSNMFMHSAMLANKPSRVLLTEDWVITRMDFRAFQAMSVVNWLSIIGIGDLTSLHCYLGDLNYIGCSLNARYIYEQYMLKREKKPNHFANCLDNIEKNTLIGSEAMAAGNLILSGIITPADRLVVQGMFTSMFRYMDYRKAARVLNVGMRLYSNPDYQECLMYGFRAAHRIIY